MRPLATALLLAWSAGSLALAARPVRVEGRGPRLVLVYESPGLAPVPGGVTVRGLPADHRPGALALPAATVRIALPPGAALRTGAILIDEGAASPGTMVPRNGGASDLPLPASRLEVSTPARHAGISYVEVAFRPLWPRPGGGLDVAEAARVDLFIDPWPSAAGEPPRRSDAEKALVRAMFANGDEALGFAALAQGAIDPGPGPRESDGHARLAAMFALEGGSRWTGSPSFPSWKITLAADGLYRLDHAYLTARGIDPSRIDVATLQLLCQGATVKLFKKGLADGSFDAGDWIDFYGQAYTWEDDPSLWESGDFTDVNAYWLSFQTTVAPSVGEAASPGREARAEPDVPRAPSAFTDTVRAEVNDLMSSFVPYQGATHWLWGPPLVAPAGGTASRDVTLTLPDQDPAQTAVTVTLRLKGITADAHQTDVLLNGVPPLPGSGSWSGKTLGTLTYTFPSLVLAGGSGANTLHISLPGFPSFSDVQILDTVDVTYARLAKAVGNEIVLQVPNATATLTATRFTTGAIKVLDVTRTVAGGGVAAPVAVPASIGGGLAYSATFTIFRDPWGPPTRRILVTAAPRQPLTMTQRSPAALDAISADYLAIVDPAVVNLAIGSPFRQLIGLRGATMQTALVRLEDVFDRFSWGIYDPLAVRTLLETAYTTWPRRPAYVLFTGDGTTDTKGHLATTHPLHASWTPTLCIDDLNDTTYLGYLASDAALGDVDGGTDLRPDFFMGRLPGRTPQENDDVCRKILEHEASLATFAPWQARVALCADDPFAGEEVFEGSQDAIAAAYLAPPHSFSRHYYRLPPWNGSDPDLYASDLRSSIDGGAGIVNYLGHGGFDFWGRQLIFASRKVRNGNTQSDIDLLGNAGIYPFCVNLTCVTGGFHQAVVSSFLEEAVKAPSRGFVGAYGPTGITYLNEAVAMQQAVFDAIYGRDKVREIGTVAEIARAALPLSSTAEILNHVVIGDPATRISVPAPGVPAGLTATPLDAAVRLDWTSVPPGASVNVYRALAPSGPFALVGTAPAGSFTHTDAGLVNAVTYHFYIAAVSTGGFEGAGSATVSATPLSGTPPSQVTGLQVADPQTGSSLSLLWTANPEPDVDGYRIHYGTSPTLLNRVKDVGAVSASSVSGLLSGVTWYFQVAARNTSGLYGPRSAVASGIPTFPSTPYLVLRVERQGQHVRLVWNRPTEDENGNPIVATGYEVYRATFLPAVLALIPRNASEWKQVIADPDVTLLMDPGAAGTGSGPYFYVVVPTT